MYIFEDLNRRYPRHIRDHVLFSGGFLLLVGIFGFMLGPKPIVIYLALLYSLAGALIARVFLVQADYTGGVNRRHVAASLLCIIVSAVLLSWTYDNVVSMAEARFGRIVLPFLLANFCLMYLPFLIMHGVKRIRRQRLF